MDSGSASTFQTESSCYSESDSSEEDLQALRKRRRPWGLRHVLAGSLLVLGGVACFYRLSPDTKWTHSAPSGSFGAETTGLFETEEFTSLMTSQVRNLMERHGIEDDRAQEHVVTAMTSATQYIGKHVSDSEAYSISNARLGPEGWETVRALLKALSDKRVQDVGHAVVQEARANLLAGPAEIGKRVAAKLQREHLRTLAEELLPPKLRTTLRQRWASSNANEDDIWKMMLDPTGENLARIRGNSTSTTIASSALLPSAGRSLRDGPWARNFKLNWQELTLGITAVVFTSAAEVLLHVDLFVPNMRIPIWAHALLVVPAISTGTVSCVVGLSFWCEFFLGGVGLNALDIIMVLSGLDLVIDGNHKTEETPFA